MKPKKGMTAAKIIKKLEENLDYYESMAKKNYLDCNPAGYQACEYKKLYIEVLLSQIAE